MSSIIISLLESITFTYDFSDRVQLDSPDLLKTRETSIKTIYFEISVITLEVTFARVTSNLDVGGTKIHQFYSPNNGYFIAIALLKRPYSYSTSPSYGKIRHLIFFTRYTGKDTVSQEYLIHIPSRSLRLSATERRNFFPFLPPLFTLERKPYSTFLGPRDKNKSPPIRYGARERCVSYLSRDHFHWQERSCCSVGEALLLDRRDILLEPPRQLSQQHNCTP